MPTNASRAVKPIDLMSYLVKLVTPKDGLVADPFAGTARRQVRRVY